MTPDDIARVHAVIGRVGAHPEFAERFSGRLFDVAPETVPMFGDVGSQQQKLTDELAAMVELLTNRQLNQTNNGNNNGNFGMDCPCKLNYGYFHRKCDFPKSQNQALFENKHA